MKRKKKPCPVCESGENMRLYTMKTKTPEGRGKYSVYVTNGIIQQSEVSGNVHGVIICPACGRKGTTNFREGLGKVSGHYYYGYTKQQ